ncbi:terpenoid synthase [Coprinellus micaceus]|uniref:Terpenoid synthase n=1 Tax=Coprinellus micaceus TaxID=71717 RepID=A0A4Y7TX07_COPMI|nr:terpenoid synthase [Coprinellus micaceus]
MQGISRPLHCSAQSVVSVLSQKAPAPVTESADWKKNPLHTPPPPLPSFKKEPLPQRIDPYTLAAPELKHLRTNLLKLLGSTHPGLKESAEYYFLHPSRQLRSLLVLLFARATNGLGEEWDRKYWEAGMEAHGGRGETLDKPLHSSDTLKEWNTQYARPHRELRAAIRAEEDASDGGRGTLPTLIDPAFLLPTQMRLAQIVEMIHIALVMLENIQNGTEVKVVESRNPFGNKLAILGGDFLLGRASTVLSRLGEAEVVELVASVISNVVEGEFLRMERVQTVALGTIEGPKTREEAWDVYLRKTYLKSASLMAKGARSAVAYVYGRNLGMANQFLKDSLEYESATRTPSPGLATAPVIYATEECPDLQPLITRKFTNDGDIELAVELVRQTSGIERARALAYSYAERAREVLKLLPDSDAKSALNSLADLKRSWL